MFIYILSLNCFANTQAVYSTQSQILTFNAHRNLGLNQIDFKGCELFELQSSRVIIEIGNLVFQSEYQLYDTDNFHIELTLYEGNISIIQQFSVAIFNIKLKEDLLSQEGTVITFKIRYFDYKSCFKNINLFYNNTINQLAVERERQIQCLFETDQPPIAIINIFKDGQTREVMKGPLAQNYDDWFLTNQTSSDPESVSFIPYFINNNMLVAYYNILIAQTFQKSTIAYTENGEIINITADYNLNLHIRQGITNIIQEYPIPSLQEITVQPLFNTIRITQQIDQSINFNFDQLYDEFRTTICIYSQDLINHYCFIESQLNAEILPFYIINCKNETVCVDKLKHVNELQSNSKAIVHYQTLMDNVTVQSYKYVPDLKLNPFTKAYLVITQGFACVQFKVKDIDQHIQELTQFVLEWELGEYIYQLGSSFRFPADSEQYCIALDEYSLSLIINPKSSKYTCHVNSQDILISQTQIIIKNDSFYIGLMAFVVILVVYSTILIIMCKLNLRK